MGQCLQKQFTGIALGFQGPLFPGGCLPREDALCVSRTEAVLVLVPVPAALMDSAAWAAKGEESGDGVSPGGGGSEAPAAAAWAPGRGESLALGDARARGLVTSVQVLCF